jgi:hypothetical protein
VEEMRLSSGMIQSIEVRGRKFSPTEQQTQELLQAGAIPHCVVCKDVFDEENPDSVELFEVAFVPILIGRSEPEGVWVTFFCKHCIMASFGKPTSEVMFA